MAVNPGINNPIIEKIRVGFMKLNVIFLKFNWLSKYIIFWSLEFQNKYC